MDVEIKKEILIQIFEQKAKGEQVKMIEIKLSQGAKPGHGGMYWLPKLLKKLQKLEELQ